MRFATQLPQVAIHGIKPASGNRDGAMRKFFRKSGRVVSVRKLLPGFCWGVLAALFSLLLPLAHQCHLALGNHSHGAVSRGAPCGSGHGPAIYEASGQACPHHHDPDSCPLCQAFLRVRDLAVWPAPSIGSPVQRLSPCGTAFSGPIWYPSDIAVSSPRAPPPFLPLLPG